ncbi:MAG: protein phosphatase 2C domain-containing protein [Bacteroidia bacterium]|nr:protein phosphatase 2C domain-containing protein [Bacteroidia bacterium]
MNTDLSPHLPRVSGYSIQGRKPSQQDAWYASPHTLNGRLVFVADGVGGHAHGEFASELCVEVYKKSFEKEPFIVDEKQYLYDTAMIVAERVYQKGQDDPAYNGCGTTLSGFMIAGGRFHLINIGDSRVYLSDREGNLTQMTKDHSVVQQLLDMGQITEEEARTHPRRNVMFSAIGVNPEEITITVGGPYELEHGDILFAFSDGVPDAITDEQIREVILKNRQNPELCRMIVDAAYEAGGKDNITACCYRH